MVCLWSICGPLRPPRPGLPISQAGHWPDALTHSMRVQGAGPRWKEESHLSISRGRLNAPAAQCCLCCLVPLRVGPFCTAVPFRGAAVVLVVALCLSCSADKEIEGRYQGYQRYQRLSGTVSVSRQHVHAWGQTLSRATQLTVLADVVASPSRSTSSLFPHPPSVTDPSSSSADQRVMDARLDEKR